MNKREAKKIAGMQRQKDAQFLYSQSRSYEYEPSEQRLINYLADLISKNSLVEIE